MKNTGGNTWTAADNYRLGCLPMPGPCPWGPNRIYMSPTDSIAYGQQKTFSFNVTAPSTPGTYTLQYQMLQELVTWIDAPSTPVTVTVQPVPESVIRTFYPGGVVIGGAPYYFSYDQLGSVREVVDASGAIQHRYDYDTWGRLTVLQGSAPRFGYAGYFYHAPSGLYLSRTRAYDPDLGRWISPDPIGERGGRNLYAYVRNNPANLIDWSGLCGDSPHLIPLPGRSPHLIPLPADDSPVDPDDPWDLSDLGDPPDNPPGIPQPSNPPGAPPGLNGSDDFPEEGPDPLTNPLQVIADGVSDIPGIEEAAQYWGGWATGFTGTTKLTIPVQVVRNMFPTQFVDPSRASVYPSGSLPYNLGLLQGWGAGIVWDVAGGWKLVTSLPIVGH